MKDRLLVYILLASCQTSAFAVQDFSVTREELAIMPAYCTAKYGSAVGLAQMAESLRGTIPPDCPSITHYCDGLKAMIRVDRIRGHESSYWLGVAVSAFQGVAADWENRGPTCPVRSEAYANLGSALLRQNKDSAALAVMNFNKALELKKDNLPAYYALSDVYLNMGKKKQALDVIEEGLKYVPDSKGLLRRFRELGGRTPPAPLVKATPQLAPQPEKSTGTQQPEPGTTTVERAAPAASTAQQPSAATGPEPMSPAITTPNNAGGESTVGAPPAVEPESARIGSPKNPYCRFCPD